MTVAETVRVLNAFDTAQALPLSPLVDAIADAARAFHRGALLAPERTVLNVPGGRFLVMPAVDEQLAITKLITVHLGNPAREMPAIRGQLFIADARTGDALLVLDGPTVTARRTSAVSLLGIRNLHPTPVQRVVIIGAGAQAHAHAIAVHEVHAASIRIVTRTPEMGSTLATQLGREGVDVSVASIASPNCFDAADVVIAATSSIVPVLPDRLDPTTLVVAVGAFTAAMAEIAPTMVHERTVVVDTLDGARHEAGDLLQAGIDFDNVRSIARCLDGDAPTHNVVFKTVGHAAWDLAAAHVAVRTSKRLAN